MKIALVDPSLFTWPYDRALTDGLLEIGHEAVLFGKALPPTDARMRDRALRPLFYPALANPAWSGLPRGPLRVVKGLSHASSLRRLHRVLADWEPDVIHFQWTPLPLLDGRFLPAFRKLAPLVLTVHDTTPLNGAGSSLQHIGAHGIWRAFDQLIVHTEQGRQRVLANGIEPARVTRIAHGLLHAGAPAKAPAPPAAADGRRTFLLFGKLKPYKGVDVLIRALAKLSAEARRQCRVRIVGKPYMDVAPLTALADELGVSGTVEFQFRFVADAELDELMRSADALLFPYREIEASGVLMAAVAQGRPVIASRLGAFAELVQDGRDGLLVEPGDAGALAGALERAVRDPGLLPRLTRGMEELRDGIPSWREISRRTVAVYEAALQARSQRQLSAAGLTALPWPEQRTDAVSR